MIGEAKLVYKWLKEYGRRDPIVLYLSIPMKETVLRMSSRKEYSGGKLQKRDDDSLEALKNRVKYYRTNIAEVVSFFRSKYEYKRIDGMGTVEEYEVDTADVFSEERALQEDRRRRLEKMKIRLEEQGLGSSEEVLREHTEVRERDAFLTREVEDLVRSAESLRALIAELTQTLQIRFADGITKINAAFDEFFKLMFGGGGAELTLVKDPVRKRASYGAGHDVEGVDDEISEDEDVEEGIEIGVHLPQKRIKGLHMLSGGERALTSIALIFAMSQVNPPPFLILSC
jgi:chromosome segregation protein